MKREAILRWSLIMKVSPEPKKELRSTMGRIRDGCRVCSRDWQLRSLDS